MKSGSAKIARRYAKGLLLLCDERGDGETVRATLKQLDAVLQSQADALSFLTNPSQPNEIRKKVLIAALEALQANPTARDFAQLLLDKGRLDQLHGIVKEFDLLLDARSGRVQAQVRSAATLSAQATSRLQTTLRALLGKEVQLETAVDPSLLGGFVVEVGNTVYDASVRNQLNRLRGHLTAA